MQYWIENNPATPPGIWEFDGKTARKINVVDASGLNVIPLGQFTNIKEAFRAARPASEFSRLELPPGAYYPYMARPIVSQVDEFPGVNPDPSEKYLHELANISGQLAALIDQLESICRVVHPDGDNLKVYGHEVRNVLILACTVVEMHWKKVLEENRQARSHMNVEYYAKLARPMRLGEYSVSFPYYPWLKPARPFENWQTDNHTLKWYAAYNAVKHNRGSQFSEGTLARPFDALAGCFIMICAQYGWKFAYKEPESDRAFLKLVDRPNWSLFENYVPPLKTGSWWGTKSTDFPRIAASFSRFVGYRSVTCQSVNGGKIQENNSVKWWAL